MKRKNFIKRNIYFYNVIASPERAWQSTVASAAWQSTFYKDEIAQPVPSKAKESSSLLAMGIILSECCYFRIS